MAEKVSEVPNSKYQSLFLVLKVKETKIRMLGAQHFDLASSKHYGTPKKQGLEAQLRTMTQEHSGSSDNMSSSRCTVFVSG